MINNSENVGRCSILIVNCLVAVEKCQSKVERRLAGCGGHHMRKRYGTYLFIHSFIQSHFNFSNE